MKNYEFVIFDADETLFYFDAFKGLSLMFSKFNYEFTKQDFEEYESANRPLWIEYQNGSINAQTLQHLRFKDWAMRLGETSEILNSAFLSSMAEICVPIDGAEQLLKALHGKVKLGIITNGFTQLQRSRLERTGLSHFFDTVVISEEVGAAKPDKQIFDHALAMVGNPPCNKVLMIGDNPHSDILGGINCGMDTCWINPAKKSSPEEIKPTYQATSLHEILNLFLQKGEEDFHKE